MATNPPRWARMGRQPNQEGQRHDWAHMRPEMAVDSSHGAHRAGREKDESLLPPQVERSQLKLKLPSLSHDEHSYIHA